VLLSHSKVILAAVSTLGHGRITNLGGGNVMIRMITEKEAGRNPKRRFACSFTKDEGGKSQLSPRLIEPPGGSRRSAESARAWALLRVGLSDHRQAGIRCRIFGVEMTVADAPDTKADDNVLDFPQWKKLKTTRRTLWRVV
jgi:hypothetical protein